MGRGDRYPALGLHWLLGSVRLAQGDTDEALREFAREMDLATPHRLYGREYQMSAVFSRGACLLRLKKHDAAIDAFQASLALYPEHAQSTLGLALALRGTGSGDRAAEHLTKVRALLPSLRATRPIEADLIHGQLATAEGDVEAAGAIVREAVNHAPAGFACWTLPIEPLLNQALSSQAFTAVLHALAARAR